MAWPSSVNVDCLVPHAHKIFFKAYVEKNENKKVHLFNPVKEYATKGMQDEKHWQHCKSGVFP